MPRHPEEHPTLVRTLNRWRGPVPAIPPGSGPPRPSRRLEVFATGPDWLQLTWSTLGPGPVEVRCGDRRVEVVADGGPGALVVDGLAPDQHHRVHLGGEGVVAPVELGARTLARPPGEELLRVATVSDVHVGSIATGYLHTIAENPEPAVPHTVRCLRAALDELTAWGAEQLVVKGDLVHRSMDDNWATAGRELARTHLPVELVPGNHERSKQGEVDPGAAAAALGLDFVERVHHVDRNGVRLLMADTTQLGTDVGAVAPLAPDLVAAADTGGPVLLALHHQPMRFRLPTYLPPGLPGPQVRPLLRSMRAVNHRLLVTSGHTHRHRRHQIHGVTATEVGSTKDFPGTWAGYHVHEGGITQFVRRIAEPSCIRWTDHTRRAAAGVWALWSPGRLDDRCFTVAW